MEHFGHERIDDGCRYCGQVGCGQGQLRDTCFGGHIDAIYRGYTMKEVLSRFLSCWWTYHNVGSFPPMRKTDYSQDVLIANFLLATVDERMYVFGNGPRTKGNYVCVYVLYNTCSCNSFTSIRHLKFSLIFSLSPTASLALLESLLY